MPDRVLTFDYKRGQDHASLLEIKPFLYLLNIKKKIYFAKLSQCKAFEGLLCNKLTHQVDPTLMQNHLIVIWRPPLRHRQRE